MNIAPDKICQTYFKNNLCSDQLLQKSCLLACGLCSTISTTTSTTITKSGSGLGEVSNCTLTGIFAQHVTFASGEKYCFERQGKMTHAQAIAHCKARNSKLPLPKNDVEVKTFVKLLRPVMTVWIDLSDPSKSSDKENWKDVEGNRPGFVKPRVELL